MNDAVEALKHAWEHAPREAFLPSAGGSLPLAHLPEDQLSTTENPMWEVVRWMPHSPSAPHRPHIMADCWPVEWMKRLEAAGCSRQALSIQYSWSIPSPRDLEWMDKIPEGRGVVEVGAGTGYWAWQLEQCGIDVVAYDPAPPGDLNRWCKGGPFTTVLQDDASAAAHHPDRALLMVWPPYSDPAAHAALSAYQGDQLIFAGEGWGGCTADDAFFEMLENEWEAVAYAERHPSWDGIHCGLAAYRRLI